MKSALVTGGAGFIGSHLTRSLVQSGVEVKVLDDLSTGDAKNLADVADHIQFIPGDVRDLSTVAAAVHGAEVVFHLAAMVSVPLRTRFKAVVDGTNGDTFLEGVEARLRESVIHASGAVVRTEDVKGRHITLNVRVAGGRIEDLLTLAVKSAAPPLRWT